MTYQKKISISLLIAVAGIVVHHSVATAAGSFYNAKFEPPAGRIYNGIGQQPIQPVQYAFNNLATAQQSLLYSDYLNLLAVANASNPTATVDTFIRKWLTYFPGTTLQLGVSFVDKSLSETGVDASKAVGAGTYDSSIQLMAQKFAALKQPIIMRPGFEFQYNYKNSTDFKAAYNKMHTIFLQEGATNVAFMWDTHYQYLTTDSAYYPGDANVDWCGYNLWDANEWASSNFTDFKSFCDAHQKPLFLPETTHRYATGTQNPADWAAYFPAFFQNIKSMNVKAWNFINVDWQNTGSSGFSYDNRLQITPSIWQNYQTELQNSVYVHHNEGVYTSATNHAPVGRASVSSHYNASTATSFQFTNTSTDYDGDTLTCSWDFGDGTTSASCNPSHMFTAAGNYFPLLTVSDGKGGYGAAMAWVTVGGSPTVSLTLDAYPSGLAIIVDGTSVTTPHTYSWTVGSSHTLSTATTEALSGKNYTFTGWTSGPANQQTFIATPALLGTKGPQAYFVAGGTITNPVCGNGVVEGSEQCDSSAFNGASCQSNGFTTGSLTCTSTCTISTSQCTNTTNAICGNGVVDGNEQCDGTAFKAGLSCSASGFASGSLACTSSCTISTAYCLAGTGVNGGGNTSLTKAEIDAFVIQEKNKVTSVSTSLVNSVLGKILLQVESHGEAWYVDVISHVRYYLANGPEAYQALRQFGLGITNTDLQKIPIGVEARFQDIDTDGDGLPDKMEEGLGTSLTNPDTDGDGVSDGTEVLANRNPLGSGNLPINLSFANNLKGRILLQVQALGQAWYVNPADGKRYYMKDGNAAYQIMRFLSLGITNANLYHIPVGLLK